MRCLSYIGGTLLCSLEIHHPQAINKSRLAVREKRVASFFSIHAFFPATFSSDEKSSNGCYERMCAVNMFPAFQSGLVRASSGSDNVLRPIILLPATSVIC